jgi:hypothetical protein
MICSVRKVHGKLQRCGDRLAWSHSLGEENCANEEVIMIDKKTKKRVIVLRTRLIKLQQMLAGVKRQCDAPDEIPELEQQVASTERELAVLLGKSIMKR